MSETDGFSAASMPGQAVYSKSLLRLYDLYVLGLSNHWIWQCPTRRILAAYQRNAGSPHLDVGVGSGYYLDRCTFPTPAPEITLLDLNKNSLAYTARRIQRYAPQTVRADVLRPIELPARHFRSIGVTFLLHCLPGDFSTKGVAFAHLAPLLRDDGVLFGATILGRGVPRSQVARALMRAYNYKGIFGNAADSPPDLNAALDQCFRRVDVEIHGCVAIFTAREPIARPAPGPVSG